MQEGIMVAPVLKHLSLEVTPKGQHFLLEYQYEGTVTMARVTPMEGSPAYALEYMSEIGWALYGQGTPNRLIKLLSNDTLGTFHGLGGIDQALRNSSGENPEIVQSGTGMFTYKSTGFQCSLQEALYFYYDLPLEVIMEPREWYALHAVPSLLDTGMNDRRLLVRFCDRKAAGAKIIGHVLYALKRNEWWAITLPDGEGQTLQEAEEVMKTVSA